MIRWVSTGDGVSRGDVCDDVHVLCLVRCMHHLCVCVCGGGARVGGVNS